MLTIQNNITAVRQQITQTAQDCARDPHTIRLLAVSKTHSVQAITAAINAKQYAFGENYVQEGIQKITYFRQHFPSLPLEWHLIGPLQSNKSRLVAEHFDWLQTLDKLTLAKRLQTQRPAQLAPLNVLIQVNISGEASKAGLPSATVLPFAAELVHLSRLRLRGLMAIPAPENDPDQQQVVFQQLQHLFQTLQQCYPTVDTLSMGMSEDMASAIRNGSTMVRVGRAIFGARSTL